MVPRALPYKVAEKPGLKSRFWGKSLFGFSGGLGKLRTYDIAHSSLFKAEALTIARMPAMIASGRTGQEHPEHLHFIYTRVGRY